MHCHRSSLRCSRQGAAHLTISFIASVVTASAAWAIADKEADWPTYRGNYGRTAYSNASLPTPLQLSWQHQCAQPPSPAWPPPARGSYWQQLSSIEPRVVDDHVFHPVASDELVLIASSADDTVRAMSLKSGKLVWRFTTEGPIRYAPSVVGGWVLVGSDDGRVYCLDLQTGDQRWQCQVAPDDRRLPGNGRVISTWPIRSGVAADETTAYVFAGLFPAQGVYAAAIDIETGQLLRRERIDASPQGYLLLDGTQLYAPMGRANPNVYEKQTGKFIGIVPGEGGTFALVADRKFVAGGGNEGALVTSDTENRQRMARYKGRQMALAGDASLLLGSDKLIALDRSKPDLKDAILWTTDITTPQAVAACGNAVVVGGRNEVLVLALDDGSVLQRFEVDGDAMGLAIAGGRLIVSTSIGKLYTFGEAPPAEPPAHVEQVATAATDSTRQLADLLHGYTSHANRLKRGFGVLLGVPDDELLDALAAETQLTIQIVTADADAARQARERLIPRGLYGKRVAVMVANDDRVPLVSRMANLVIASHDGWTEQQARRLVRPAGGLVWHSPDAAPEVAKGVAGGGEWTHLYGSPGNTAFSGDQLVGDSLKLQWFGGPGPHRMTDRHLRAPAPLAQHGRLVIPGENRFICIDSFNGTELWDLEVPGSQRYSIPYDCGYYSLEGDQFAVATGDEMLLVEVTSGEIEQRVSLATACPGSDRGQTQWGYLAKVGSQVFGSTMKPSAARTEPGRQQITLDYNNAQPLVTSERLFLYDLEQAAHRWTYEGCVLNPTITVTDQHVLFVASSHQSMLDHETGRVDLAEFLASQPELVCLDRKTGGPLWTCQLPQPLLQSTSILYVQSNDSVVTLVGSLTIDNDTTYRIAALEPANGEVRWQAEHRKGRPGAFTHGEQLHHPVLLADRLIAEPAIYSLADGARLAPDGSQSEWVLKRPGHSCGTISASQNCVFFRAANPTMLSLATATPEAERIKKLAPTRPGCWINIVPADGLVLVPEASASCVCLFSLQTSLAFTPDEEN